MKDITQDSSERKYDDATMRWLSINDPNRRRYMWHQRVIYDRDLTATAVRIAGLVMHDYELGQGGPVRLPLQWTAERLGLTKSAVIRARDLLVARGWLMRINKGSTHTGAYELGPGPRGVYAAIPPSNMSFLSSSNTSKENRKMKQEGTTKKNQIKNFKALKRGAAPPFHVVEGGRS